MEDRIKELNLLIENTQLELAKQAEYNDLLKKLADGKPSFSEFMDLAVKFISHFEKEIETEYGTVDGIHIEYLYGEWYVRYNLRESSFQTTVYNIHHGDDVNECISKHVEYLKSNIKMKIQDKIEEMTCIDDELEELKKELEMFEGK